MKRLKPNLKTNSTFDSIQKEGEAIFSKKNLDYGDSFRSHGAFGVLVRMTDKMNRLNNLTKHPKALAVKESLRDTAIDLMNYSAMYIMLLDEEGAA